MSAHSFSSPPVILLVSEDLTAAASGLGLALAGVVCRSVPVYRLTQNKLNDFLISARFGDLDLLRNKIKEATPVLTAQRGRSSILLSSEATLIMQYHESLSTALVTNSSRVYRVFSRYI